MTRTGPGRHGTTRRGFLLGATAGLAAGGTAAWLAARYLQQFEPDRSRFTGKSREDRSTELAMPGPYPGRVIRVRHPAAVRPDHSPDEAVVRRMVDRGITALVDGDPADPRSAWRRLFGPGDVVGIKVNPVGRAPKPEERPSRAPHAVGVISSPVLVVAVALALKDVGVKPRDIIVFERYADEFRDAGYLDLMTTRPLAGVRWLASATGYSDAQVDLDGFDGGRKNCPPELARHVAGYDPDVFAHMGFCAPQHDPRDDRRFRSHLSMIVSRMVNKVITIPNLKDHRSAGVTLALKNMSHGFNNNVARSHVSGVAHGLLDSTVTGPNQCNTFIPHAVAQHRLRQKATLHLLDGLVGVYEGGPGSWNKTWGTWHANSLYFATDPVALDHVGWDEIDRKRAAVGWAPVADMGLVRHPTPVKVASEFADLAAADPLAAAALRAAAQNIRDGRASEVFDLRTPQHVSLAGDLGLGVFDPQRIDLRSHDLV